MYYSIFMKEKIIIIYNYIRIHILSIIIHNYDKRNNLKINYDTKK